MATKAEVKDGRMCVPMAYIAAALGVEKSWDATTKTATFTNVKTTFKNVSNFLETFVPC